MGLKIRAAICNALKDLDDLRKSPIFIKRGADWSEKFSVAAAAIALFQSNDAVSVAFGATIAFIALAVSFLADAQIKRGDQK
ncbi:MAG: hypothetical protein LBI57_07625 [Helicobacteraceae bacterium]|nr:hypothetical protein [Helicobacteraceae bacterium]